MEYNAANAVEIWYKSPTLHVDSLDHLTMQNFVHFARQQLFPTFF
jgi:hypothetical protein